MGRPARLRLRHALLLTLGALFLLLGLLFSLLLRGSRQAVLQSADGLRQATAQRIALEVSGSLGQAAQAAEDLARALAFGVVRPDDAGGVEAALFAAVLNRPALAEATFTRAAGRGFDADGALRLGAGPRTQISVFREGSGEAASLQTRRVGPRGRGFVSQVRRRRPGGGLGDGSSAGPAEEVGDPTDHITFRAAAGEWNHGSLLWSDLHFAEADERLAPERRRVLVTVQKAVWAGESFLGVVRVGLNTEGIDRLMAGEGERLAPHCVFLCDTQGRLLSRLSAADRLAEVGDDLRVQPASAPGQVTQALARPELSRVSPEAPVQAAAFGEGAERYLATFQALPGTQGWIVGVVAPESLYVAGLTRQRDRLLLLSLVLMGLVLAAGLLGLRAVQGGLDRIVAATARMEEFDFVPAPSLRAPFVEVEAVLQRLEQAKTAMRALGKYVPIGLVRLLYQGNREPHLGGELAEVTVLFTDVKDFTTLSEQLSPDDLAQVLGRYLDVMTRTIQGTGGIIDKYIGDAVMAAWNVPLPCEAHEARACRAALLCVEATRALFASPEWSGRPPLVTRFGLHRDTVMAGHFGAPDRLSYTLIGDGVNLASRLEGLNKQYGTQILVSEDVRQRAGEGFRFRLLDRVAVKGKARPVQVYELLDGGRSEAVVRAYEEALARCWARDFAGALARLEAQLEDPPSAVLAARARAWLADPPEAGWDGVHAARSK